MTRFVMPPTATVPFASRVRSLLLWTFCAAAACTCEQAYQQPSSSAAPAAAPEVAPEAAPEAAPPRPPTEELTAEDIRIINADPATLTPEERRKRPYALRRKIMQNPDSPAAKSLEELRKAIEAGEIDPRENMVEFEARGANVKSLPAPGGSPPAGSRPTESPSAQ